MADGFRIVVNDAAPGIIGDALEAFLADELGPRIQSNAKRTVPVGEDRYVGKGERRVKIHAGGSLKKAIVVQVDRVGDNVTLQVGVDAHAPGITVDAVDYGLYVERGTSKMAAQPYLIPALYQARGATP